MSLISQEEVRNILYNLFSNLMTNNFQIKAIVTDTEYKTVNPKFIVDCIVTDPILAKNKYRKDIFDCDDYAMYLKTKMSLLAQNNYNAPLAVGILITNFHAFNFCIDDNSILSIINTQSENREFINNPMEFGSFLNLSSNNSIQLLYI